MDYDLGEPAEALLMPCPASTVRSTCRAVSPLAARAGAPPDKALDAGLARAGLFGIEIPERFGGGFVELALVVEALGGRAAPSRLTASAVQPPLRRPQYRPSRTRAAGSCPPRPGTYWTRGSRTCWSLASPGRMVRAGRNRRTLPSSRRPPRAGASRTCEFAGLRLAGPRGEERAGPLYLDIDVSIEFDHVSAGSER
jgi:hypothetical protein